MLSNRLTKFYPDQFGFEGFLKNLKVRYKGNYLKIDGSWRKAIKGDNYSPVKRSEFLEFYNNLQDIMGVSLKGARTTRRDFCLDLEVEQNPVNYLNKMIGLKYPGIKRLMQVDSCIYFKNKGTINLAIYDKGKELWDKLNFDIGMFLLRMEFRDNRDSSKYTLQELLTEEKFDWFNHETLKFIRLIQWDFTSPDFVFNFMGKTLKEAKVELSRGIISSSGQTNQIVTAIEHARGTGNFTTASATKLKNHYFDLLRTDNVSSVQMYHEMMQAATNSFMKNLELIRS